MLEREGDGWTWRIRRPYAEAVRYWWYYGMPDRMDADKNGIPCETVYSSAAVNAFWYP